MQCCEQGLGGIPKLHTALEPFTVFGATVPASSWNLGLNFQWTKRRSRKSPIYFILNLTYLIITCNLLSVYHELDTIVVVPYLWGTPRVWTGNLDVARQVVSAGPGSAWIKPREYSKALL